MEIERAIEILNPLHREHYDSITTVNEACRMGMNALKLWKYYIADFQYGKNHILIDIEALAKSAKDDALDPMGKILWDFIREKHPCYEIKSNEDLGD